MPKSKLIVSDPKTGKSTTYELNDDQFRIFKGLKIGGELDGSSVNIEGNLKITGGSDNAGFPMRSDVLGGVKKYVLLTKGVGFRTKEKGLKRRKLVRGNTITDDIYQINALLTSKSQKDAPTKEKEDESATQAVLQQQISSQEVNVNEEMKKE